MSALSLFLTLARSHTHVHLSLCWGTIKTVYNAATYSSARTLNCVNVWVHVIFQGCHSLRLFSPVFNYWAPWLCRLRMHDIPAIVRECPSVCSRYGRFSCAAFSSVIYFAEPPWVLAHLFIRVCTYVHLCVYASSPGFQRPVRWKIEQLLLWLILKPVSDSFGHGQWSHHIISYCECKKSELCWGFDTHTHALQVLHESTVQE